ncbi:uncharacterized protein BP5553_09757 [Venustampulla echinocandica]|uniref:Uncharacterized protein n=1 Tax=Venustampulla echinocandica TaxID=2656787 RepID=A0A370TBW7_9HELO|nr:uncharacterized protein BP5553_09757 [Venustampulla echinocandica]RDL31548.1 hypothetical protein BP5553_09757 [Venustampulla echinocandica]
MAIAIPKPKRMAVLPISFDGKPPILDEGEYPDCRIKYHFISFEASPKTFKPLYSGMYDLAPFGYNPKRPDEYMYGRFLDKETEHGLVDVGYRDIWCTVPLNYVVCTIVDNPNDKQAHSFYNNIKKQLEDINKQGGDQNHERFALFQKHWESGTHPLQGSREEIDKLVGEYWKIHTAIGAQQGAQTQSIDEAMLRMLLQVLVGIRKHSGPSPTVREAKRALEEVLRFSS